MDNQGQSTTNKEANITVNLMHNSRVRQTRDGTEHAYAHIE